MSWGGAVRYGMRLLALAGLGVTLAACGFHLRGRVALPPAMDRTYILGANDTLNNALRLDLLASGVRVVTQKKNASAVLKIENYGCQQSVLSLTPAGQVSGYLMVCSLGFSAKGTHGKWALPLTHLSVRRNYTYSVSQVLSKHDEVQRLQADMDRELASLIMLRLQAAAQRLPAPRP